MSDDQAQRDDDVAEVVRTASVLIAAKKKRDIERVATLLANTRPNDGGTEGEWAIRLYESGSGTVIARLAALLEAAVEYVVVAAVDRVCAAWAEEEW